MPSDRTTADWSPFARLIALLLFGLVVAGLATVSGERPRLDRATDDRALASVLLAGNLQTVAPRQVLPSTASSPPVSRHLAAVTPSPSHHAAAPAHHAQQRWLPTGTGMWTYVWDKTEHGNARIIVARARQHGIRTIYLRTGSRGTVFLDNLVALLKAAHGTGIKIVAWDFPNLKNPVHDARRLATAANWRAAGDQVAAVAPDIETRAEGTHLSRGSVALYLSTLRRLLPRTTSIFPTVPWPSSNRLAFYPYSTVASYADGLIPMAYWYNHSAYDVTMRSVRYLSRFGKPVMPVGQGYDSRIDAPYLPPSNQPAEMSGFLHAAHNAGVRAISLWDWQTAGHAQWHSLDIVRNWFGKPTARTPAPAKPRPRVTPPTPQPLQPPIVTRLPLVGGHRIALPPFVLPTPTNRR